MGVQTLEALKPRPPVDEAVREFRNGIGEDIFKAVWPYVEQDSLEHSRGEAGGIEFECPRPAELPALIRFGTRPQGKGEFSYFLDIVSLDPNGNFHLHYRTKEVGAGIELFFNAQNPKIAEMLMDVAAKLPVPIY